MTALPLLAGLLGCAQGGSRAAWLDQLQVGGPCYEADLLDGLSETDTDELHATFDCLSRNGAFLPLEPVVDALDAPTREGEPAGIDAARLFNQVGVISLLEQLPRVVDLMRDSRALLDLSHMAMELLYGRSWEALQAGDVDLRAGSELDQGLLRPLLPVLPSVATVLLDDDAPTDVLVGVLQGDGLTRTVYSVAGWSEGPLSRHVHALPKDMGAAIAATRSPGNDRWPDASGDSLRDLSDALILQNIDGRPALEHLVEPAHDILDDRATRTALRAEIEDLIDDGHIAPLPQQLLVLAEEDVEGGRLQVGEDSALVALLRLLHDANGPMRCSIDLGLFDVGFDVDNLAVALLEALAQQDPNTVDGGVGLLGDLVGESIPNWALEQAAASGVCDVLDAQLVADLEAIDRLTDPQTGDLLIVLLRLLAALDSNGRIPETVDLLSVFYAAGAVQPIEEVLRDVAPLAVTQDVVNLLPALVEPTDGLDPDAMPDGLRPVDVDDVFTLVQWVVDDAGGSSPIEDLTPVLQPVLDADGMWVVTGNAGTLLTDPRARLGTVLEELPDLLPETVDGGVRATLADLLQDPALMDPALRILETPEVSAALERAELAEEGPLPYLARLVVGGTLAQVLALAERSLELLSEE